MTEDRALRDRGSGVAYENEVIARHFAKFFADVMHLEASANGDMSPEVTEAFVSSAWRMLTDINENLAEVNDD